MADKFNDYDELLGMFESKKPGQDTGKTQRTSAQSTNRPARTYNRPTQTPSQTRGGNTGNTQKPQDRNQSYKGGVYFSNAPRNINRAAERQKAANNKNSGLRGRTPPMVNNTQNAKKKKQGFFQSKKFTNALITLGVIAVVSLILCVYGIGCINDVLALNRDDTAVEITVQAGMTDSEVLDILDDEKLISNKLFCKLFLSVFDQDGDYIGGVYTLTPSMGVEKMIATMKSDYTNSETVSLTFPEGWTVDEIAEKLEANDVCTATSFISTLQNVDFSSEYEFIADITDKEQRFRVLEGYIYPDTYEFYVGENASSVVRRFLDNFQNRWSEEYQAQADAMGVSVDEVIIMASILQKEAANTEQMPMIAGILYNRLDRPNAFPLLQCDSTEDYLLETIKPSLTSTVEDTQLYIQYRDLYDTYSEACKGLPVGAIANPGDAAIKAALFPEDTSYLYFRHDSKGNIYYASSFAEHQQNGRKVANADS
ncbi:MAG: endolytic transglycosylase MltG [Clostridia bacterium]|nr:endolytic transglycosylase MltG [Clostridia bacterium]